MSETALGVSRALAVLHADPVLSEVLPPGSGAAHTGLLAGILPGWRYVLVTSRRFRLLAALNALFLPGVLLHLGLRKRYVEDQLRAGIVAGIRQMVVVGAGLDPVAPRLAAEYPEVRFLEVDHPATQRVKLPALERLGELPGNLHLVPADLTDVTLEEALRTTPGYRVDEPVMIVAEGLLMYLEVAEVQRFFGFVGSGCAPQSRVIFTHLEANPDGTPRFDGLEWLLRWKVQRLGEPFRWAIAGEHVPGFLDEQGLEVIDAPRRPELRRRYLEPLRLEGRPLSRLERFVVARLKTRSS